MRTMNAKNLTLQMLGIWLVAIGAWGLLNAPYVSIGFVVGLLALAFGSTILLTQRR